MGQFISTYYGLSHTRVSAEKLTELSSGSVRKDLVASPDGMTTTGGAPSEPKAETRQCGRRSENLLQISSMRFDVQGHF